MVDVNPGSASEALRREPVWAVNGLVATSHPLAAQAGLRVLQAGGNAVDAAIATAAALTVLEPCSNGLGSDAFAQVWTGGRLVGINGSGRAPMALDVSLLRKAGHDHMPGQGWLSVTVPGAVRLWGDLHERHGRLPFSEVLGPAIAYAEDGAPVPPVTAHAWAAAVSGAQKRSDPAFAGFLPTFAPQGRAPRIGERFRCPGHARTLRAIADHGAGAFYRGAPAEALVEFARRTGGLITGADLEAHTSTWVEPIAVGFRGHSVHEIPPNGQGIAALIALGILDGCDPCPEDAVQATHLQIEAMKLGFADAHRYVADPEQARVPTAELLDPAYLSRRRALITARAGAPAPGLPLLAGTVYLCTADRDGMMVSLIQSNFWGFGSGIVVPEWGIALQNRGAGFSLDERHPNSLAPGKRPYHTIIPGFLCRDGQPVGPFGVMGGHMQPQGHVQVMTNSLDRHQDPQQALDQPRWRYDQDGTIRLEANVPRDVAAGLAERGHRVVVEAEVGGFGKGQIIWRQADGVLIAGSEARCDGMAVGF